MDVMLNFLVNKVIYDNVNFINVKGVISIKDEVVFLSNVFFLVFGGDILFFGNVLIKEINFMFIMDLDLKKIDIGELFG